MIAGSVAILVVLAVLAPILHRLSAWLTSVIVAGTSIAIGALYALRAPEVLAGEVFVESWPWVEQLGLSLSFRLDGLSMLFALLISVIGGLVLLFSGGYFRGDARGGRFYATLLAFMASMLGLVVADNLLLIFAFWELTSITSFLLIGFGHERERSRWAAVQALLVTGLGGLVLLAGLLLLGFAAGTFEVRELVDSDIRDHALYVPAVICVLVGCFSKSAIFPFHFWLPNAMEAPSPVSALLHSSTMVKAGVYLIARLHPSVGGTLLWDDALIIFGGITMVLGAFHSTRKRALKPILAYSTVSSLGVLVMLIGMGAAKAAAAYLLAHAMFKACLFLAAGAITKITGEKEPERLGGLIRVTPILSIAAALGALSLAGMFPLAGFVGKELVLKAGLAHPEWATAVTIATVVAAVFTVMAACVVGFRPFFGKPADPNLKAKPAEWRLWLGPLLLGIAGMIAGVAPALFAQPLVESTIVSISGAPYTGDIKLQFAELLWPPTTATILSIVALTLGVGLYAMRALYRRITTAPAWLAWLHADDFYDHAVKGSLGLGGLTTRLIQNGHLHSYVRNTLLAMVLIVAPAVFRTDAAEGQPWAITFLDGLIAVSIIACALVSVMLTSALAAVATLGGIGFLMALLFVLYGVPDVAMTQFAVETLIVIIFVLVIYHLPKLRSLTSGPRRATDATVAAGFGLVMGAFAYLAAVRDVADPVSEEHALRSMPEGFGRNIVNVILVDFRALDTFGEIFVLAIAATGVYTLLRLRTRPEMKERS
ncbi:MAG: hydrogen gas-evolving membrane-bound hydrogenase subunit E [Planctomycetota bacterium]